MEKVKMKRLVLILCLLLALLPLAAEAQHQPFAYVGNMEVVNCSEWVSLREEPSTGSRRLVQVSLGSVVANCCYVAEDWCYAEFDGYCGYILSEYLKPCENVTTFSAMLVTNCEKAVPWYASIDAKTAFDWIEKNTIVRNCHVVSNEKVYVEYGGRCGFVEARYVEPYDALIRYPEKMTLNYNMYSGENVFQKPVLLIDDAQDFKQTEYDYTDCEQEDEEIPRAEFVLHSDATLSNVQLFKVEFESMDEDTGDAVMIAELVHIQPLVNAEETLSVSTIIYGTLPEIAVGYQDEIGVYHFAFVEISGEDGRLMLKEF